MHAARDLATACRYVGLWCLARALVPSLVNCFPLPALREGDAVHDPQEGRQAASRSHLRLVRSDGAVPHSSWPLGAEVLEPARARYPDVRNGRQPVLGMAPNGDLWLPGADRPVLVRRCDVATISDESGSPPPP